MKLGARIFSCHWYRRRSELPDQVMALPFRTLRNTPGNFWPLEGPSARFTQGLMYLRYGRVPQYIVTAAAFRQKRLMGQLEPRPFAMALTTTRLSLITRTFRPLRALLLPT